MSDAPRPLPIAHRAARGNRSGVKYGLAEVALTGAARIAPPRVSAELTERLKKYELATKALLQLHSTTPTLRDCRCVVRFRHCGVTGSFYSTSTVMCQPPPVDAVQVTAETPIDKPPTATVGATAEKKSPTKTTKKAKIQVAGVKQVDEDDELAYPVTPGKILSLSSQERPALLVALILRIISEGAGMVMPLLLAEAYDAVIDGYGSVEEAGATRDTVTRVFTLALTLHVAGNVFGFLAGCATGVAGERVVSRLRRRLYDHLLTQEMSFFDTHKSGDLVSRLGADTLLVQQAPAQALTLTLTLTPHPHPSPSP